MSFESFDKHKALLYVVEQAKKQHISKSKLTKDVIDPSNFNKMIQKNSNREIKMETLILLARRLKITDEELRVAGSMENEELLRLEKEIRYAFIRGEFSQLQGMLATYGTNKDSFSKKNEQYYLYAQGLYMIINNHYQDACEMFLQALRVTSPSFTTPTNSMYLSEREIEIYSMYLYTIGYYMNGHFTVLPELKKLLNHALTRNIRDDIIVRLYYNYAIVLKNGLEIKESIRMVNEGINYCMHTNNFGIMPQLFTLSASLYDYDGNLEMAKTYREKAAFLMEIYHMPIDVINLTKKAASTMDIGFWDINI